MTQENLRKPTSSYQRLEQLQSMFGVLHSNILSSKEVSTEPNYQIALQTYEKLFTAFMADQTSLYQWDYLLISGSSSMSEDQKAERVEEIKEHYRKYIKPEEVTIPSTYPRTYYSKSGLLKQNSFRAHFTFGYINMLEERLKKINMQIAPRYDWESEVFPEVSVGITALPYSPIKVVITSYGADEKLNYHSNFEVLPRFFKTLGLSYLLNRDSSENVL